LHLGTALLISSGVKLPQYTVEIRISEVNNAVAHWVGGSLTHHTVRRRVDRAIRVSGDELQRLTKIDDEMARQRRHVLKFTADLDLQARRTGVEYRDKPVVGVRPQPPVKGARVVVNKIKKRITAT